MMWPLSTFTTSQTPFYLIITTNLSAQMHPHTHPSIILPCFLRSIERFMDRCIFLSINRSVFPTVYQSFHLSNDLLIDFLINRQSERERERSCRLGRLGSETVAYQQAAAGTIGIRSRSALLIPRGSSITFCWRRY